MVTIKSGKFKDAGNSFRRMTPEEAQQMQEQMAATVVVGESGAGLVKVRATAKGDVTGLEIDPSILVASEKEVVEDLIVAAIKDAQIKGQQRMGEEMRRMTEALGLPADMKLPF